MASDFAQRRRAEESINTQQWHSVTPVLATQDTIMKYFFDRVNHTYDVMVYDGNTLRHEHVDSEQEFVDKNKVCFTLGCIFIFIILFLRKFTSGCLPQETFYL